MFFALFCLLWAARYFGYINKIRAPVSSEVVDRKAFMDRFNSPLDDLVRDGVIKFHRHDTVYKLYQQICYGLALVISVVGIATVLVSCTTSRTLSNSYTILNPDSSKWQFQFNMDELYKFRKQKK